MQRKSKLIESDLTDEDEQLTSFETELDINIA